MPFSRQELDEKYAWMRERQRKRQAAETAPKKALSPEVHARKEQVARVAPRMLRIAEVAAMLGVSRLTVRRQFRAKAVKLRGCVLIPEQVVQDALRLH